MEKLFSSLDVFGFSYTIKTNGKDKFKTLVGACLTLLVLAIAINLTFLFGADFLYMRNPIVLDTDIIHDEAQEIYPTTKTHPFMIRYEAKSTYNQLDAARIYIDYQDWRFNKEKGISHRKCFALEIKTNCAETELKNDPQWSEEVLSNWFCVDFEKVRQQCAEQMKDPNYEPFIGGYIGDERIGYIQMGVANSEMDNKGNRTFQAKIDDVKKLGGFQVDVRYPKFYLRKEERFNALTTRTEIERFNLLPQSYLFEYRYMKQVRLDDDIGWIQEEVETTHSLDIHKVVPQYYTNMLDKEGWVNFYSVIFTLNRNERVHKRRFMKLSDLISRVAGSMSPIILCISFIATLYNKFCSEYELVQTLFDKTGISKNDTQTNTMIEESKAEESRVKKVHAKETIQLSFFSYYFITCRQSTTLLRNREFFKMGIEYIEEKIDVRSIIDLYEKFTKLCELTLSGEQQEEMIRNRKTMLININ